MSQEYNIEIVITLILYLNLKERNFLNKEKNRIFAMPLNP